MDDALLEFKEFAKSCMAVMRKRIEAGEQITTMAFALLPSRDVVVAPVNAPSSTLRGMIMQALVESTEARALLLVSDGWIKDPHDHTKRIGEMLSATLITRDHPDAGVGYGWRYTRNPFVWEPLEEATAATFAYDVFPRSTRH